MIDFTVNLCNLFSKTTKANKFEEFISIAVASIHNDAATPCPTRVGYTNATFSGDDIFKKLHGLFKFILPAGDHKWEVRLFDSHNTTYMMFIVKSTLKALNGTDLSMLSMG